MKPAIVVVAYNRPLALKRLLISLDQAEYLMEDITLIISIDKAVNESDVLEVANKFNWRFGKKIIRTFEERQGLRKHVLSCGDLSDEYGAVIILEDDLYVSKNFFSYTVSALDYYHECDSITGIALYSHEWNGYAHRFFMPVADGFDTYLGQFSITWGQCWTKKWWGRFRKWYEEHKDSLGENENIPAAINTWSSQSWGRYFVNYIVENDLYYVIPRYALSTNCSEIGQHATFQDTDHQVRLLMSNTTEYRFAEIGKCTRYDIFFENMDLKMDRFVSDRVTIDLNGIDRENNIATRYLLSTKILPFKVEKSFGISFRPIDMNVIQNIAGEGIYLYDCSQRSKCPRNNLLDITRYELRGMSNKQLVSYIIALIKRKLLRRK